jgi:methylenetetrahydrofolate dehydrogenase (NADP+) / methenyltetrahydrofolate cyclohydrolase
MTQPMPTWEWGQMIRGRVIMQDMIPRLTENYAEQIRSNPQHKIVILQFEKPLVTRFPSSEEDRLITQYYAANDSTKAKVRTFEQMGVQVEVVQNLSWDLSEELFVQRVQMLVDDPNVRAFIIQTPMPIALVDRLKQIDLAGKDIDAQSEQSTLFSVPATSEAMNRVLETALDGNAKLVVESATRTLSSALSASRNNPPLKVAVIGSSGNIGKPIVQYLRQFPARAVVISIEQGDPEFAQKIESADVIVSTAGRPGLLTEQFIKPHHQLVIDCGYAPQVAYNAETEQEEITVRLGDVARSAYGIAQNITPVPGGTGPLEMAVLAERYIQKEFDPDLQFWRLQEYFELRTFNRTQVQELQVEWAQDIFAIAARQFDQSFDQDQLLQTDVCVVRTEQGYNLTLDRNERTFTIEGDGLRGELAKFQFEGQQPQLIHAKGLAGSDLPKFQEMQQNLGIQLASPSQRSDRQLER